MLTIKNQLHLFVKRFFVVLVFYSFCRLLFFIINKDFFDFPSYKTWLGGMRFDLSALGYLNLIFGLAHVIPGKFQDSKTYQRLLKILFFGVNTLLLGTNFVDFEYYKFIGRRSSFSMITAEGMEQEIPGLLLSYVTDYWYIPLLFLCFAGIFWMVLPTNKFNKPNLFTKFNAALSVLCLLLLFVAGRGGIQSKPLRIVDASEYAAIGQSALVLNTPFTILKTIGKKETLENYAFFSANKLNKLYSPIQNYATEGTAQKKNVVILILESFGRENIQRGQTPFLDSLITESYYFENGFANGKVSVDAVPSIISSIPSLMNKSFISSSYALNKVKAFPEIMKENGYHSSFFHGAFNGSQNFEQYCNNIQFDKYYGMDQYKGPKAFDGFWGIFDEEFMQYFRQELNTFKQPFFTTLFTISSHPPFTMPERHKGKFNKGTTEIHETIAYSDYALAKFFEKAKKEKWYNNTLFVLSADHTSACGQEAIYKNNLGKFRIPILFFDPSNPNLKGVSDKNFQQIDIMPSILDYLDLDSQIVAFGKSYKSKDNYVVNYIDNQYNYIQDNYYLVFDGKKTIGLFDWKKDPLLKDNLMKAQPELKNKMEVFIKAYIQSFNERVIKNQLTLNKDV